MPCFSNVSCVTHGRNYSLLRQVATGGRVSPHIKSSLQRVSVWLVVTAEFCFLPERFLSRRMYRNKLRPRLPC
ncbi:hypothetical protein NC651_013477 [Populus alba x Populus x berolinensis]|nr:hypothetical protein NC651_013477 [Populus alba x Populus x berolinensis]